MPSFMQRLSLVLLFIATVMLALIGVGEEPPLPPISTNMVITTNEIPKWVEIDKYSFEFPCRFCAETNRYQMVFYRTNTPLVEVVIPINVSTNLNQPWLYSELTNVIMATEDTLFFKRDLTKPLKVRHHE